MIISNLSRNVGAYCERDDRRESYKRAYLRIMRRLPQTIEYMPMQRERERIMSESMQEMMEREKAEAIATLNRANRALDRIFGIQEKENEDE